jgi:hypothetical protein
MARKQPHRLLYIPAHRLEGVLNRMDMEQGYRAGRGCHLEAWFVLRQARLKLIEPRPELCSFGDRHIQLPPCRIKMNVRRKDRPKRRAIARLRAAVNSGPGVNRARLRPPLS